MRNLALKEGLKCSFCGEKIESDIFNTIDGEVCESCYNNEYVECYECGVAYNLNEVDYLSDGSAVCPSCLDDLYTNCDNCNTIIRNNYVNLTDDNYNLCDDCFSDAVECEYCGAVVYQYEIVEDCYCCVECYRNEKYIDIENSILNYSYKKSQKDLNYWKTKKDDFTMGLEWEIELDSYYYPEDTIEVIRDFYNSSQVILKEDGSLINGVELVFDPVSVDYLKKTGFYSLVDELQDYINEYRIREKAGVHIHISRKLLLQNDIVKLINLFYHIEDYLINFINRTESQKNDWCRFPKKIYKKFEDVNFDYIRTRYLVINPTKHTIEIRAFSSTDNAIEIIDYMKFVKYCYLYVKNISNSFLINNNSHKIWLNFLAFIKKYDIRLYEKLIILSDGIESKKEVKIYRENQNKNNNNTSLYLIEYEEAREEL